MERAFRRRLGLASALMGGLVLAGFAAISWQQMHTAELRGVDLELLNQAERELSRRWPVEHWIRHEPNLGRAFGLDDVRKTLLLVQVDGREEYRSVHWPGGFDPASLPWPRTKTLNPDDKTRVENPPADPASFFDHQESPPLPSRPVDLAFSAQTIELDGHHWRFGLAVSPLGRLIMGIDLVVVDSAMAPLGRAFLMAAPLALGLIGFGAWWVSGTALAPIRRLSDTMETITAKGLGQRVDASGEDREFQRLIAVFNGMLERLERGFLQASRFSADAAHELKTPLAILQGQIERAMFECGPGSPAQIYLAGILDEVQRLGTISRKLLLLSLADGGRLRLRMAVFDLSTALADLLEDAEMLAPELEVHGDIAPNLCVQADAELLRQLLHNLLGNAIKYNQPEGWIRIAARRIGDRVEVSITNASADIPAVDRERIFERFFRTDPARGRSVEGVGLGLSLSREIARAHGGELVLADSREGESCFVLSLLGKVPCQ